MTENTGWRTDPLGRHEERYFKGSGEATPLVRNNGVESYDLRADAARPGANEPVLPQPTEVSNPDSVLAAGSPDTAWDAPPATSTPTEDSPTGSTNLGEPDAETPRRVSHYVGTTPDATLPVPVDLVPAVPYAQPPTVVKRKRSRLGIAAVILVVLVLIGAGGLAYQQHTVANTWMHDDQQEVQKNTALSSHVSSLNGQVSNLDGQVSSLQTQLSSVANQKAKALDQNAVLTTALNDAAGVANDLNTCVNDTQIVLTDISTVVSGGFVPASAESDATTTGDVCRQAQSEESALQAALAGA